MFVDRDGTSKTGPWRPAPWKATRINDKGYKKLAVVEDKPNDKGLVLVTHTFDGIEAEANIQLMAAAPEMYEALVTIKEEIDSIEMTEDTGISDSAWKKLIQALVRARGEQTKVIMNNCADCFSWELTEEGYEFGDLGFCYTLQTNVNSNHTCKCFKPDLKKDGEQDGKTNMP